MVPIKGLHSQTIFTVAPTRTGTLPFGNAGRTLRFVVHTNVAAEGFTVVFSNAEGTAPLTVGAASIARCDENGTLAADTLTPLTVGGVLYFTLAPGEDVHSDAVPFPLEAGGHFALSLYYPEAAPVRSGNWLNNTAFRSRPGNYCADAAIPGAHLASRLTRTVVGADMAVQLTSVFQIIAHCKTPGRTLACFGDSITQQSTWTGPLAKRLHKAYPGEISLCNLGIAGNRLLADSAPELDGLYGPAGVKRFAHDVLGLEGLTHAILALGANDIGQPGTHGIPAGNVPNPDVYAEAMRHMAETLHKRGVTVYAATITPRTYNDVYGSARDAVRRKMNGWIRTAPCFDAVLDFDLVTRRTDGADGMRDRFAQPDGLHPTPLGGLFLAKSIPLSLFAERGQA